MKQDRNHDGGKLKKRVAGFAKSPKVWIAVGITTVSLTAAGSVIAGAGFLKDGFDPSAYGSDTQESNDVAYDSTVFGANQDNNNGKEMDQNAQEDVNLDQGEDPLKDQQTEESPILLGTEAGNSDNQSDAASNVQGVAQNGDGSTPVVVVNPSGNGTGTGTGTATPTPTSGITNPVVTPTAVPSTVPTATPTPTVEPTQEPEQWEFVGITAGNRANNTDTVTFYKYMTVTETNLKERVKVMATYQNKKDASQTKQVEITDFSCGIPSAYAGKELGDADVGQSFTFEVSYNGKSQTMNCNISADFLEVQRISVTYKNNQKTSYYVGQTLGSDAQNELRDNIDVTAYTRSYSGHVNATIYHFQNYNGGADFAIEFHDSEGGTTGTIVADKSVQTANAIYKDQINVTGRTVNDVIDYKVSNYRLTVMYNDSTVLQAIDQDNATFDLMAVSNSSTSVYNAMIQKLKEDGLYQLDENGNAMDFFYGWSVYRNPTADDYKNAITKYTFGGSSHNVVLYPLPLKAIDSDYEIKTEGTEQVLVGYKGDGDTLEVPYGVTSLEIDNNFDITAAESAKITTITIPGTVHKIDFAALAEKFPNLTAFKVENSSIYQADAKGALFTDNGATLLRLPTKMGSSYTVPYSETAGELSVTTIASGALDDAVASQKKQGKQFTLVMSSPVPPELDATTGTYGTVDNPALRIEIPDSDTSQVTEDYYLKYYASAWGKTLDTALGTKGSALLAIMYTPKGAQKAYKNNGNTVYSQSGSVRTLEFAPSDAGAEYTIDNDMNTIGSYAFYRAAGTTVVHVPDSVTDLEDACFATASRSLKGVYVTGNQKITLGNKIAGDVSATDTSLVRFFVSSKQETISGWRAAFEAKYGKALTEKMLVIGDGTIEYVDGCVYLKDLESGKLTFYSVPEGITSYTAPEGLTSIASNAFKNAQMTTLVLPEVTYIEEDAFVGCDKLELLALTAEADVTVDTGFEDCSALAYALAYHANRFAVPEGAALVTDQAYSVEEKILYEQVESHEEVVYAASDVQDVIALKDNTTVVQKKAFEDCTQLVGFSKKQWDAFTDIGEDAFAGCTGLTVSAEVVEDDSNANEQASGVLSLQAANVGARAFQNCSGIVELNLNTGMNTIGERAFADCTALSNVNWLADTTKVGDYLFENDSRILALTVGDVSLEEKNVPVTTIGAHTFQGCSNMITFDMFAAVRHIGDYAFQGCSALNVKIYRYNMEIHSDEEVESVGAYAFADCTKTSGNAIFPNAKNPITYGEGAYMNCKGIGQIILPKTLKEIPDYCFMGCTGIKLCYLSDSLDEYSQITRIGTAAFSGCYILQQIYNMEFCENLKTIEASAFSAFSYQGVEYDACEALQEVLFPENLESIGDHAFEQNYSLQTADFTRAKNLDTLSNGAFTDCELLSEVNMQQAKITTLEKNVFNGCISLSTLVLPETLATIKTGAIENCDSLTAIIGRSPQMIQPEEGAFGDVADNENLAFYVPYRVDHKIKNAYLASSDWAKELKGKQETIIQEIGDDTIVLGNGKYTEDADGTVTLQSVFPTTTGVFTVNEATDIIAPDAFAGCSKITMVIMPDDISSIPDSVFKDCTNLEVLLMRQMSDSDDTTGFVAPKLEGTLFGTGTANENFRIYTDDIMTEFYDGYGFDVYGYGNEYRIDSNVLYGRYTDNLGDYYKMLYVPRSYTGDLAVYAGCVYIVDSAAEGCTGLKNVVLNIRTEEIGKRAFAECSNLEKFYAPNTTATALKTIGEEAFMDCVSLVGKSSTNEKRLTLPISVRTIERAAFKNCTSLTYINIQGALSEIADETFEGCTSLGTYTGTTASLASVERIGKRAFYGCTSVTSLSWTNMTNLKEVDDSAYEACSNLFIATFADKLERIGDRAFWGSIMQSISFNGANPPELGSEIMEEATQDNIKIFVPNGAERTSVAEVYIAAWQDSYPKLAAAVQGLDGKTFRMVSNVLYMVNPNNAKELTAVRVPTSLPTASFYQTTSLYCIGIGDGAVRGCNQLKTMTITANIKNIGAEAFADCTSLKTVPMQSNVLTSIGTRAFANCSSLVELDLPASITSLGDRMLEGAAAFEELWVDLTDIPPSLGAKIFGDTLPEGVKIYVPEDSYDMYMDR